MVDETVDVKGYPAEYLFIFDIIISLPVYWFNEVSQSMMMMSVFVLVIIMLNKMLQQIPNFLPFTEVAPTVTR